MNRDRAAPLTGLILSGGGARAAYQVGVLHAIASWQPVKAASPFKVLSGTSAGAINAAVLAMHADDLRIGTARLLRLWRRVTLQDVYRADPQELTRLGLRYFSAMLIGRRGQPVPNALLDNQPLVARLLQEVSFPVIRAQIACGQLHALAINATSYTSGQSVTFFEGAPEIEAWQRSRRRGERTKLHACHIIASSAIPFVFPPIAINNEFYGDGAMRQLAPLSPALHLGAERLLVIAVGQKLAAKPTGNTPLPVQTPTLAGVAGHALSSIFLDNFSSDIEHLNYVNRILSLCGNAQAPTEHLMRKIQTCVITPSFDVGALVLEYVDRLPRLMRGFLNRVGATYGTGGSLLSYIMFDAQFCNRLMALGMEDASAQRSEIEAFLRAE